MVPKHLLDEFTKSEQNGAEDEMAFCHTSRRRYNGSSFPQNVLISAPRGCEALGYARSWNTTAFNCWEPITVAFVRRVGDILKMVKGKESALDYRYYM